MELWMRARWRMTIGQSSPEIISVECIFCGSKAWINYGLISAEASESKDWVASSYPLLPGYYSANFPGRPIHFGKVHSVKKSSSPTVLDVFPNRNAVRFQSPA